MEEMKSTTNKREREGERERVITSVVGTERPPLQRSTCMSAQTQLPRYLQKGAGSKGEG